MKKPKLRELGEAVKSLFSRPYTSGFPYREHVPPEKFRGRPRYFEEDCIGCGACYQVCPARAIDLVDEVLGKEGTRRLVHHPGICLFCGECERNCTTGMGIRLTREFDVSYFQEPDVYNSVQHRMFFCPHCGEPIGTEKHLLWVFGKLGNLAFSQPAVISRVVEKLDIETGAEEQIKSPIGRTDALKMVCPKCKRIAFISDEKR